MLPDHAPGADLFAGVPVFELWAIVFGAFAVGFVAAHAVGFLLRRRKSKKAPDRSIDPVQSIAPGGAAAAGLRAEPAGDPGGRPIESEPARERGDQVAGEGPAGR